MRTVGDMYASIHRYQVSASTNVAADIGWRLGAVLTQSPGFVTAIMVEDAPGALVTIVLFEDRASLEAAAPMTDCWTAEHRGILRSGAAELATGEVVAQKGL